jgi:hypothetical protein
MDFDLGNGNREDLIRLGEILDGGGEEALQLTEQVLKIRNRLGSSVGLSANRAQREYAEKRGRRNIILKARQMGVTTWIAGRFFLKTITHPGTVTIQVAHTQEAAEQIFRIVHRFLDRLPEPLRQGALKTAKRNMRRIAIPELDSEYLVETAGDRNAGRGLTITNLHCTELARWPGDAAEIFYGLQATLAPDGELALESTPNGASGCFWKEWQDAEQTSTIQHFFPWWYEATYVGTPVEEGSLTETEQELMKKHTLSPAQIAYRRQIQRNFRTLARQEFAEDADACFLASGECIFEVDAIEKRLREVREPMVKRRNGRLRVWLPRQDHHSYLVAVDPAGGGTDGDYSAMEVVDMETGLQCAELEEHLGPLDTAREAAELAREYHDALLVVERNNHGSGVLAHLEGHYGRVYTHDDGKPGFLTSTATRPWMISQLGKVLVENPEKFNSDRLLRQCRSFVRKADGGSGAQAGEHDDCVMAMAIALAVRGAQGGRRTVN